MRGWRNTGLVRLLWQGVSAVADLLVVLVLFVSEGFSPNVLRLHYGHPMADVTASREQPADELRVSALRNK